MTMQRGFDAKVRINLAVYDAAYFEFAEEAPGVNVGNTEGTPANPAGAGGNPAVGSTLGSQRRCRATVRSATFNDAQNLYAAPYLVRAQSYLRLEIYPSGLGGQALVCPSFYVESVSHTGDVQQGGQPVSFSGVTDGNYSIPG